jgi:hypothetical protein
MPLQRGEVQGYNFNRMAIEFTMVHQGKVVPCLISTAAMDDLEGRRDVKSDQRIDQFMRLREIIEERASRKFFEEQAQADRPVVLYCDPTISYHDGFIVLAPTPPTAPQPPEKGSIVPSTTDR